MTPGEILVLGFFLGTGFGIWLAEFSPFQPIRLDELDEVDDQ